MWLPGSIKSAIAGEDHADEYPTIMEPSDTATEASIWVFVMTAGLPDGPYSDSYLSICVSERNIAYDFIETLIIECVLGLCFTNITIMNYTRNKGNNCI